MGASAGALRLPVLATGFSIALVGGSGSRSGSSSGSLPEESVRGVACSQDDGSCTHPASRRGSRDLNQYWWLKEKGNLEDAVAIGLQVPDDEWGDLTLEAIDIVMEMKRLSRWTL